MIIKREKFKYRDEILIERLFFQPPHTYEVTFQNEGCFLYVKGGDTKVLSSEAKVQIDENEAVLLNCGTYFVKWLRTTKDEHIEVIAFHLYPNLLKALYRHELPASMTKSLGRVQVRKTSPNIAISKFIDSLIFYFENPDLLNEDLLELKIKELLLLLIQTHNAESILQIVADLFSPTTTNLRHVIELHLYENLSVNDLAKLCHLSPASFKRKFTETFNDSPNNYITFRRIEKSKELLTFSDLSISEISHMSGIQDPQYFTRLFKKRTGETPSAFRRKMK